MAQWDGSLVAAHAGNHLQHTGSGGGGSALAGSDSSSSTLAGTVSGGAACNGKTPLSGGGAAEEGSGGEEAGSELQLQQAKAAGKSKGGGKARRAEHRRQLQQQQVQREAQEWQQQQQQEHETQWQGPLAATGSKGVHVGRQQEQQEDQAPVPDMQARLEVALRWVGCPSAQHRHWPHCAFTCQRLWLTVKFLLKCVARNAVH